MLKPVDPATAPTSSGYGFGSVDRKRARSRDPPTNPTYARKKAASEISFEFQSLSLSTHGLNRGALVSPNRPSRAYPPPPDDTRAASAFARGQQSAPLGHTDIHNHPPHDTSNSSNQSSSSSSSSASSPLPCSPYSPLSPQLSRSSSSLAITNHDDDTDMSRQDSQETLFEPPDEQHLDSRHDHGSMAARVLNIRQRKWNSARKEWQEWHEVQATHAPDLSSIMLQQEPQAPQGTTEQMELLTDSISSSGSIGGGNTEGQLDTYPPSSDVFADPHGGDSSLHASRGKQSTRGQSNGLGRQRSLHDSRERSKDMGRQQHLEPEERHPVSTRTRSFSETHIHPYTQHHLLQLQQIQPNMRNPSPFYQMPIPQRAGLAFSHTDSQHQYGSHRGHDTYSHLHHTDCSEMESNRNLPSSGPGFHRLRHSQSGSSVSEPLHTSHPWTSLTMTPLDGALGPGPGTSSSRRAASVSLSSALSPTYGHREEPNSWTQQLLHSQGVGSTVHHNYFNPIHPHHGQHHGDDVAMGEETVARGLPSRSSSPSPCLSMVPTVNRPLSISFSQLVGSHMLEDLAEHDDDMEL